MNFIPDHKIIEYFHGCHWRKVFNEEFRHFPTQKFCSKLTVYTYPIISRPFPLRGPFFQINTGGQS